jgi:hypothetical protein
MAAWAENQRNGLPNDFDLDDIRGAAATLVIAGNDTVCHPNIQQLCLSNKAPLSRQQQP